MSNFIYIFSPLEIPQPLYDTNLPGKLFSLLGGELTFFVDIEDVRKTMGRGKDVLFGYETSSTFMYPFHVVVFLPIPKRY